MFIINVWFFITNVIYIDTDREYIYIERSCWNTIVHLLWKRKRPTSMELVEFKKSCYQIYFQFVNSGKANQIQWNSIIKKIQLENASTTYPNQEQPKEDRVITNDYTEYEFDQYYSNEKPDLPSSSLDYILNVASKINNYDQEIETFINYLKSESLYYDSLVITVSFPRIKTILHNLLSKGDIKLHNKYEFAVIEMAFYFGFARIIIDILDYNCTTCSSECTNHIRYFYLCRNCYTVNCHKKYFDKNIPIDQRQCDNTIWFDRSGKLIQSNDIKFFSTMFSYKGTKFTPRCNHNLKNIMFNDMMEMNKQKQLEQDQIHSCLVEKDKNRKFSGLMLSKETLERRESITKFNKKETSFVSTNKRIEISPISTLVESPTFPIHGSGFSFSKKQNENSENNLVDDNVFLSSLKSPLLDSKNSKSSRFKADDICPDCSQKFKLMFGGNLKCKCRTIDYGFSSFSFSKNDDSD